jgi:hypothetical protein
MERVVEFLVRGECGCGWWMAAPEGARWPQCPECGEQVMPPRPPGREWGAEPSSPEEWLTSGREGLRGCPYAGAGGGGDGA